MATHYHARKNFDGRVFLRPVRDLEGNVSTVSSSTKSGLDDDIINYSAKLLKAKFIGVDEQYGEEVACFEEES
ncbi:hypothetical protein SIO17_17595 [Pseudoalteromonas piscicida]|uniref:Uncharacterized protein n=1 Tax=Pseudoalteromonas piscicida TaxID=43662 RepID=A0ABN5CPM4_PSEO7|nr:hypothetical protein [Pseudoalteromonas piscicida]ATD08887.1 hypothetical protein PPIS_a4229 [Pseudoalteromonas piscicida]WPU30876.1 hypothetical protein SIO17_17595 [Pseudoalteromonas piscicida]